MKEYAISVVTPCHDVNIMLLGRAFDSLKQQTLGFEHIEWIIVIHNCSEQNTKEIEQLVQGYDNVKTFHLTNDRFYAASPRNHGLQYVTGKRLVFLDADDYFEPDIFEASIRHMDESDTQMLVFRYEVAELGTDLQTPIHPFCMLDQTRESIVLERDSWDSSQFVHGEVMNLGTKVYDMAFMRKHGIRFDEEIPFAEEGKLHLQCYGHAQRICFLPQHIGYIYCRYGESILTTMKKTSEQAMRYARGFKSIFDCGAEMKLDMNEYTWDLLGFFSAILLASMDLTYRDRSEIKRLLWPYRQNLKPLTPSKAYTKEKIKLISMLTSLVLAHPLLVSNLMGILKLLKVDVSQRMNLRYDQAEA